MTQNGVLRRAPPDGAGRWGAGAPRGAGEVRTFRAGETRMRAGALMLLPAGALGRTQLMLLRERGSLGRSSARAAC